MTTKNSSGRAFRLEPLGIPKAEAATFVGFEEGTFEKFVDAKLMPPPLPASEWYGRRCVWSVHQLREAFGKLVPAERTLTRDQLIARIGASDVDKA